MIIQLKLRILHQIVLFRVSLFNLYWIHSFWELSLSF